MPSVHVVPFVFAGLEQIPVAGAQTPTSGPWSAAVQTTGFAPTQTPAWHVSACVQEFASLHVVPLTLAGSEQRPVAGAQTPTSWHWSLCVQTTGLAPTH